MTHTHIALIILACCAGLLLIRRANRRAAKDSFREMTSEPNEHTVWVREQQRKLDEEFAKAQKTARCRAKTEKLQP